MTSKNQSQLSQQLSTLKQQYNTLLDKNQNDLIKIKQKQKTFNETVNKLKQDNQDLEKKYKKQIDTLILQIQKYKHDEPVADNNNKQIDNKNKQIDNKNKQIDDKNQQITDKKRQIDELTSIVQLKTQRIEHLQENTRKLMDQNIDLTAQKEQLKQKSESLQQKNNQYICKIQQLTKQLENNQNKVPILSNIHAQTEGDHIISEKQHKKIINQFNQQIKKLSNDLDSAEKQTQNYKHRLLQTNSQLKRYMDRDRRNSAVIKRKNQQIANVKDQFEIQKKKSHKVRKLQTEESCSKCKQWQQENKLLKQMVKSVQTMVRVKQMEAQRYKTRQLTNSKLIEKTQSQTKRSRGQLPPLKKNN